MALWRSKSRPPELRWCLSCRYWTTEDGTSAAHSSESEAQCRRYPPGIVSSNEFLRIAHEDRRFEKPYIPDRAWVPQHVWPVTYNTHWCGEWDHLSDNDAKRSDILRKLSRSMSHGRGES